MRQMLTALVMMTPVTIQNCSTVATSAAAAAVG